VLFNREPYEPREQKIYDSFSCISRISRLQHCPLNPSEQSFLTLSASTGVRCRIQFTLSAKCRIRRLNPPDFAPTLDDMGKTKIPATGEGYLGEIMVHRLSRAVGVVESITLSQAGWPPQITLKLPDGTLKKGRLSDFREPSGNERAKFFPA
jgi:hypothetical protein